MKAEILEVSAPCTISHDTIGYFPNRDGWCHVFQSISGGWYCVDTNVNNEAVHTKVSDCQKDFYYMTHYVAVSDL